MTQRVSAAALIGVAAALAIVAIRPRRYVTHDAPIAAAVMQPATIAAPSNVPAPHPSGTAAVHARASSTQASDRDVPRLRVPRRAGFREPVRPVEVAAVTVAPTVIAAAERAVRVAPVRLDVAPRQSLGADVAVDPPAGTRADIIRTGRPGVTVVWLY